MKKIGWMLTFMASACQMSSDYLMIEAWNPDHTRKVEVYLEKDWMASSEQIRLRLYPSTKSKAMDLAVFDANYHRLRLSTRLIYLSWQGNDSLRIYYDDHLKRQILQAEPAGLMLKYIKQ
ncbi:hypothetical protein [Siphonobacter curvatus]|uniref:Uncharacterized protein n=1 Tax=Siphonobacter curvatus TaxID=2094562 RepID=A0A2S7IEP3_9BACT|nr:hypothetical protein [Siphonobacter curvatus]PQA53376.1 hypothetical protein C5O19_24320 [Siphonobacter curvatus]